MLHIVSSGLQDRERLNSPVGSPSVHFYKTVMRRRTRWASQWRRVEFDNLADFGKTAVVTLPIQGELITRATLVVNLPDLYTPQIAARTANPNIVGPSWAWTNSIGHALCSDVQMLIGDQIIDEFDSRSLEILSELTTPIEHYDSTNQLIARDPSAFSDQELLQISQNKSSFQAANQTVEIVFPFWWNRGPGPQALPIQALWKDKVQLKVTFRPVQQCVYTSTRLDPRNPPLSANQGSGSGVAIPNIVNCAFFAKDPSGTPIYNAAATAQLPSNPFNGQVTTETMPASYHFLDAYWIIEYVSLEDREAAAYRTADLEFPIEQHLALPVVNTGGTPNIRIRMDRGGLVRDLTWVAQRVEAESYNAYFLFSKDLGPPQRPPPLVDGSGNPLEPIPVQNPCDLPWWPNAIVPDWDYGNGYIRPAFADRNSDPILAAKMTIRGLPRFEHEGPSMFRSVLPLHNCQQAPLINRYIYRYDFGYWPTGGLAEANELPVDEIRGYSNWDKLPKRELALTMNLESFWQQQWTIDGSGLVYAEGVFPPIAKVNVPQLTDGLLVILQGAQPDNLPACTSNGTGATVAGIIDYSLLQMYPDFVGIYPRVVPNGSASLVMKVAPNNYIYLAVAGAGGYGNILSGEYVSKFTEPYIPVFGGKASSAVEVGWQGGNNTQTSALISDISGSIFGGNIVYSTTGSDLETITYAEGSTISSKPFILLFNAYVESFSFVMNNLNTPVQVDLHTDVSGIFSYTLPRQTTTATQVTYTFTRNSPLPQSTTTQIYVPLPDIEVAYAQPLILTLTAVTLAQIYTYEVTTYEGQLACTISTTYLPTPNVGTLGQILFGGGGGGGANPGAPDGSQMDTSSNFVQSLISTGGQFVGFSPGGDGYYGGGSGVFGGGGGSSYVSPFLTCVNTFETGRPTKASVKVVPLTRVLTKSPNYNIYSWITRYNRLRITSGRGALMFNEASS
jgi:hypothetical protein